MAIKKKGVSPVIATVLLIGMVVVMGLVIFVWFKSMFKESITKFGGQNIETVCEEVKFSADYSGEELSISNDGNVPIYSFKVSLESGGTYERKSIGDITTNWPSTGINQGGVFSGAINIGDSEKIVVIPVLVGESDSGRKTFVCDDRFGVEKIL